MTKQQLAQKCKQWNNMKILGIDTSCDDTSISLIEAEQEIRILSNIVSSQVEIHKKYGGVYPTLAKREHQKNLVPVLGKALENGKLLHRSQMKNDTLNDKGSGQTLKEILGQEKELYKNLRMFLMKHKKPDLNLVAITVGPGLDPCLWMGVNFAKVLSYYWKIPVVPINHLEAHLIANWLIPANSSKPQTTNRPQGGGGRPNPAFSKPEFPAVGLIVSGGHTQLILMKDLVNYKIIGETRDDAAGECFDKTARILGLGYPGGPAIEAKASRFKIHPRNHGGYPEKSGRGGARDSRLKIKLPRPMLHSKNYDFSFSGLKTAVLYDYKKRKPELRKSDSYIRAMAYEIQQAIIDVLIKKTLTAAKNFEAKSIMLGGGVAANKKLRKQLNYQLKTKNYQLNFLVPPKNLCTDNAAMVAATGYFHRNQTKSWKKIKSRPNLRLSNNLC